MATLAPDFGTTGNGCTCCFGNLESTAPDSSGMPARLKTAMPLPTRACNGSVCHSVAL
eukprot:CAMPEP_0204034506 /NCGR_PEP_ID=MMETSP0360-20130528/74119_1 /ASSEMBLY_ACC=CAM_ASM_000342 /TAXON_ID=268821 /ORGANISM="Scrippsiella Hangoei, Strain SHTV-5" /LENGTH=57 /DNA_ID=CAMNT_0050979331 /DNA_START=75 /DNA_END=244 /DNA_ORIENTATION=+